MTFQPPPPPPPGGTPPPPPPPPGYGGPAGSGAGGAFDPKSVDKLDWGIVGIGGLLFIFSFFSYYTFDDYTIPGYSIGGKTYGGQTIDGGSFGGWHTAGGTFVPWLAMIVAVLAAAAVAIALFAPTVKLPLPARVVAVLGFGISVVLYLIGFAAVDLGDGMSFGFSYWLSLILAVAGVVLALMRAQQTNTALPGPLNSLPKIG